MIYEICRCCPIDKTGNVISISLDSEGGRLALQTPPTTWQLEPPFILLFVIYNSSRCVDDGDF